MATGELRRAGGFLDKITRMISLVGFLDEAAALLPLIQKWAAIDAHWTTVAGIKARALVLVEAGEIIAPSTETTIDDLAVVQFKALASNDALLESVAWVFSRFYTEVPGGTGAQLLAFVNRADVKESIIEKAEVEGLSVSEIMTAIKLITELLTLLKGMFAGAGTATETKPSGGLFDF